MHIVAHINRGNHIPSSLAPSLLWHSNQEAYTMSGKVVTIFEKVANSGWQINQEHLSHIFQSVGQNHVSIFSINGSSRTGKSFTLNYFLKYLLHGVKQDWIHAQLPDYFVSDSGGARVTTGIKMWSEPLYLPLPNAERIAIILLDTQGLFDDVTSSEDNTAIYAFSSLLSSLMIYNVMSNMDERHWQFLESFLAYANLSLQDGQDKYDKVIQTYFGILCRYIFSNLLGTKPCPQQCIF